MINCYLDNFKKTHLHFQPLHGDAPDPGMLVERANIAAYWPDGRNNGTGPQMRHLGYRNAQKKLILPTKANLLDWLPGDIVHNDKLYLPHDMPLGKYQLEIAIVSSVSFVFKQKQRLPETGNLCNNCL